MLENYGDVLTIKDIMKILGVGRNTAYGMLQDKTLKYRKYGKRYFIPKQSIIDFLTT